MTGNRYYLRRHECWGGTYVWSIADSQPYSLFSADCVHARPCSKAKAQRLCDRANDDWLTVLAGGRLARIKEKAGICQTQAPQLF